MSDFFIHHTEPCPSMMLLPRTVIPLSSSIQATVRGPIPKFSIQWQNYRSRKIHVEFNVKFIVWPKEIDRFPDGNIVLKPPLYKYQSMQLHMPAL